MCAFRNMQDKNLLVSGKSTLELHTAIARALQINHYTSQKILAFLKSIQLEIMKSEVCLDLFHCYKQNLKHLDTEL